MNQMEDDTNEECEIAVNSLLTDNEHDDDDDGLEEETNCSYITSGNQIFTDDATMVLIEHYKQFLPQVGKTIKTRTIMWQQIANLMKKQDYNYSPVQLDNKFRSLKRSYLKRLTQSLKKGKRVKSSPFDKDLIEALHSDRLLDVQNDHAYDDRTYKGDTEMPDETPEDNNTTVYLFESPNRFEEDTMAYNLSLQDEDMTDMEFLQELSKMNKDSDDHADSETVNSNEKFPIEKGIWTPAATNLLVKLTQKYFPKLRSTFGTKRNMWDRISKDLNAKGYVYNVTQVENKFRSLKRYFPAKRDRNAINKTNISDLCETELTPMLYQNERNDIEVPVVKKGRSSIGASVQTRSKIHGTRSTTKTSVQGKPKVVFLRNTKTVANDTGVPPPMYGKCIIGPKKYTENEMFDRKMELKRKQIASIEKLSGKLDVTNSILHNIMLELRRQSGS